jgi:hypothetical protein
LGLSPQSRLPHAPSSPVPRAATRHALDTPGAARDGRPAVTHSSSAAAQRLVPENVPHMYALLRFWRPIEGLFLTYVGRCHKSASRAGPPLSLESHATLLPQAGPGRPARTKGGPPLGARRRARQPAPTSTYQRSRAPPARP